jgi:hypothetical protein
MKLKSNIYKTDLGMKERVKVRNICHVFYPNYRYHSETPWYN